MRGDRPKDIRPSGEGWEFTPHARGSTLTPPKTGSKREVYPACAGIDLRTSIFVLNIESLPRMRGDRPQYTVIPPFVQKFTPHARGSTPVPDPCSTIYMVYPACAGIDRGSCLTYHACLSLPRMRGDRPTSCAVRTTWQQFTPHARGSTPPVQSSALFFSVYPACAGIDPLHHHAGYR